MARLAVIGNISLDHAIRPDGQLCTAVGGAALHIALAATAAGLPAAPIAVVGHDMRWLPEDPSLASLDWTGISNSDGKSAAFTLTYDTAGDLVGLRAEHGVANELTDRALQRIEACCDDVYHVCCRTPLDTDRVLGALTHRGATFSVDFIVSSVTAAVSAANRHLPHAQVVFVNSAEHQALASTVAMRDLAAVVVSDGPRTAKLYRHGRLVASANPPPATAVRVTGAGDTLTGTFLAALSTGLPDDEALRLAVAAASAHTASPFIPAR